MIAARGLIDIDTTRGVGVSCWRSTSDSVGTRR
jgi:hypothetical protein